MKMHLTLGLFILLAMLEPGFGQQADTQDLATYLVAAQKAQARKDYAAAEVAYEDAVKLRPETPELWANLGLMQDALSRYPVAIANFRKAIALNPDLYVPNLFLGIDYTHINRAGEAVPYLLKAQRINPHDPQVPLSLGQAYLALRNFAAARKAFRRAIALDDKNGSAWFAFGVAALDEVEADGWKLSSESSNSAWAKALFAESLQKQLRFKEAISQEQALIVLDPSFPCAHSHLGFSYIAQQQDAAALQEFEAESQGCALAALGHARLSIDAGDKAKALVVLGTLWDHDPGFVRSHLSLLVNGLASERSAEFSTFLEEENGAGAVGPELYSSLSTALRGALLPVDPFAFPAEAKRSESYGKSSAAEADAKDGRYARCATDLEGDVEGDSDHDYLLLARCAFLTGNYNLSVTASDRLVSRSPRDLAALYWSVKADEELASVAFGRFEQLEPNSERTHLLLGDIFRQRQRYLQAESEYKMASALAPLDPAPIFGLASAYAHGPNLEEALGMAKRALEMSPDDSDTSQLVGEILVSRHEWIPAEDYLKRALDGAKPQVLSHLHALLGQVYEHTGRVQEAISELQMGLTSDEDGSLHYQLARLYSSIGNKTAAQENFQLSKQLEEKRRERAVIAVQDSSDVMQNDIP